MLVNWLFNFQLWFDVEKERDTTIQGNGNAINQLWFDVEKERDTTYVELSCICRLLWFDVEKERDTTKDTNVI